MLLSVIIRHIRDLKHRRRVFLLLCSLLSNVQNGLCQQLEPRHQIVTNGQIRAICADSENDQIYFGGEFTRAGHMPSNGAIIDAETGLANRNLPSANGEVYASAPDGRGGFYFGGEFTMVGDSARRYLAHVDASGQVTNWGASTNPNQAVSLIYPDSDKIYIAGVFQAFDGWYQSGAALVHKTHATPDTDFPKFEGIVYDAIEDGEGGWYLAGSFYNVGDQERSNLAHVRADGVISDFMKDYIFDGSVNVIDVREGTLFVGGNFTTVRDLASVTEGHERNRLAAFDLSSGEITEWAPSVEGTVKCLQVFDDKVYVGGLFSTVNGTGHQNIAEIDIETGLASSWSPYAAREVLDITVTDSVVFFDNGYILSAQAVYAVDRRSGEHQNYYYEVNSTVRRIAINGNLLMVGTENGFSVFDLTTALELDWGLDLSGTVHDFSVARDTIFLGGRFNINGIPRSVAAIDGSSGRLLDWELDVDKEVYCTVNGKNGLFIGGRFKAVGGQGRRFCAALDTADGKLLNWDIAPNRRVLTMASRGDRLYLGGSFTEINGQEANAIVAINKTTGMVDGWVPDVKGGVGKMALDGDKLYLNGIFYEIEALDNPGMVCLDLGTDQLTNFRPGFYPTGFTIHGDYIYAVHSENSFITVLDKVSGEQIAWDTIGVESGSWWEEISLLEIYDDKLYVAGKFETLDSEDRNSLASIDLATKEITSWNPYPITDHILNKVSSIYTLSVSGSSVFVGGNFVNIGGLEREGIAAMELTTGEITGFAPSVHGGVDCIKFYEGIVYFGGYFDAVNGQDRKGLAAVDAATGQLTEWKPEVTSGAINDFEISGQSMFIGGSFKTIDGLARHNIAELDLATGALLPWAPEVGGRISDMQVHKGNILIGGSFNSVSSRDQKYLACVNALTGQVTDWNPSLDGWVSRLALAGDQLLIVGDAVRSVHLSTGDVSNWSQSQQIHNYIYRDIEVSGDFVYLSGKSFNNHLDVFEKRTGHFVTEFSGIGHEVSSLDVSGNHVVAGGLFVDEYPRKYGLTVFEANLPDVPQDTATLTIENAANWTVCPNPAISHFRIDAPGLISKVVLLSLDGRLIKEYHPNHHSSYSLDGVEDGVYLVYIDQNEILKSWSRLIVNRKVQP